MLLIYPPGARSTEPPLGLARLAASLRACGVPVRSLDLNHEGLEALLAQPEPEALLDTWARVAVRRRDANFAALRAPAIYACQDAYVRAVRDLNHALKTLCRPSGAEPGLADYHEAGRSPHRRADLVFVARRATACVNPALAGRCDGGDGTFTPGTFVPGPFDRFFHARIAAELEENRVDVVGISVCYLSQALPAFALAGIIRALAPRVRIVLGGGLITSWLAQGRISREERFEGFVDALVGGSGEDALPAILAISEPSSRNGRVTQAFGSVPDFSDFAELRYLAPTRIVPYNFSRGCPWRKCSFCPETAEATRYAGQRKETALADLGKLAERYAPGLFHFTDNEVAPLYLRALAEARLGVPWYGFARFTPLLADEAVCRALAASGCAMLQLGLESGDQNVLNALGKGTTLDLIDRSLHALADAGIGVYLYLLFGTPAEDRSAALRTRDFVAERASLVDFLNIAIFNMPISSPEATRYPGRDFYEGELALYRDFQHPRGWNRNRVREFISRDFEREPRLRGILNRTPLVFTSNHAPFFAHRRKTAPVGASALATLPPVSACL